MRKLILATGVAFLPFAAFAAPQVPADAPTVEQFAAYPKMSGFRISPDGKHMVALEGRGEDRVILVWKTDRLNEAPTVIGSKEMKVQSVTFLKDDLLGVALWQPYNSRLGEGVTKTFITKFFTTDLEGRKWNEALRLERARTEEEQRIRDVSSPILLDNLPNDPDHILIVNTVGTDEGDVFKVNIRNWRAERIQRSDEDVAGYATDQQGNLRARIKTAVDGKGAYIATEIRDTQGGGWSEHFRSYVKERDQVAVVGFLSDPSIALVASNLGQDKAQLFEYDVRNRKMGPLLFGHKFFDAAGATTFRYAGNKDIPQGEIMNFVYLGPREGDLEPVAPAMQALDKSIRDALKLAKTPGRFVDPATGQAATVPFDQDTGYSISSYDRAFKTFVIAVDGSNQPPTYYLLRDGKLTFLARAYPDLKPEQMGTTRLVYYKARDGLDIPAFLTKPNATKCGAGPWPAVVHPHGGPWARDAAGFDGSMWVPLMSSRCIAVLQPQFRGSDGWGRRLWKAGDAEWGQKMQDDKDDGAKWLIEQKVAIPGRMAMFGFSYGGYSSMAAAIRPNGLYKCAIAGAGVSDINRIWRKFYTNTFFREAQAPTVKGLNPRDHADKIQIPIMVYHGDRDQIVPIEQSEWYVAAAKKSGQPVEYHEFADYAHGPAWTRKIMADQLRVIDNYLTKGCGGGGL